MGSITDPFEVDSETRLEIRQLIALNVQLELMSIFCPNVIGPSIQTQLLHLRKSKWQNFMCACNALFKDEPSYRGHLNSHHKDISDMIC